MTAVSHTRDRSTSDHAPNDGDRQQQPEEHVAQERNANRIDAAVEPVNGDRPKRHDAEGPQTTSRGSTARGVRDLERARAAARATGPRRRPTATPATVEPARIELLIP